MITRRPVHKFLRQSEQTEDESWQTVLHSLNTTLNEDSLELHQDLEIHVDVSLMED